MWWEGVNENKCENDRNIVLQLYEQGIAYEADIDRKDGSIDTDTIKQEDSYTKLTKVRKDNFR